MPCRGALGRVGDLDKAPAEPVITLFRSEKHAGLGQDFDVGGPAPHQKIMKIFTAALLLGHEAEQDGKKM